MPEQSELTVLASNLAVAAINTGRAPSKEGRPGEIDFSTLMRECHAAVSGAEAPKEPVVKPQKPAVPIRKSVQPDHIVCLEDGQRFKSLKRHLRTHYDLSPDEYRQKWGLPADYPMVAPSYSETRSRLAKDIGLGRKPNQETSVPA